MPLQATAQRLEFAPPAEPGQARGFVLALLAHLLLAGALGWGIAWKRDSPDLSAEAELWSATAQQAAPALVEAPPPPPPPPEPLAKPIPPAPAPQMAPPPQVNEADIALARDKEMLRLKREADKAEKARLEKERLKKEADKKAAEKKAKQEAADRKRALAAKSEKAEKSERADKDRRTREEADAKRVAQLREENLKRMQGLAGASGSPSATGTALKSSGPSDSYAGRIRAKVRPNIVFTEDLPGNPVAEVEVKMSPDGTITSRRITQSSGVKAWDEAVLRALDRTEVLPRDLDGRVHSPLLMEFRPKGL